MRFCTNCGKELSDDALFCTGCGTSVATPSGTVDTTPPPAGEPVAQETPPSVGPTISSSSNQYTQGGAPYQSSVQNPQAGAFYQGETNNLQSGPYYQGGQGPQSSPYYQGSTPNPYVAPNYSAGKPGSNKIALIIVAIIVAIALIGGGIFLLSKLSSKNDDDSSISDNNSNSNSTDNDEVILPSIEVSDSYQDSTDTTTPTEPVAGDAFSMFDADTADNIMYACEDIGLDVNLITDMQSYGSWYVGSVYTFMYKNSVIDMFLNEDETVYSIETGGIQIYLMGYESYLMEDYLGYVTHYDEVTPDTGYVFFYNGYDVDSTVTVETSSDMDYVIEFLDANTGDLAIAFYVKAGSVWSMAVPTGDYIIQYAAGSYWDGIENIFGSGTLFYSADSTYAVYPENENIITLDIFGGTGIPSTEITGSEF